MDHLLTNTSITLQQLVHDKVNKDNKLKFIMCQETMASQPNAAGFWCEISKYCRLIII